MELPIQKKSPSYLQSLLVHTHRKPSGHQSQRSLLRVPSSPRLGYHAIDSSFQRGQARQRVLNETLGTSKDSNDSKNVVITRIYHDLSRLFYVESTNPRVLHKGQLPACREHTRIVCHLTGEQDHIRL